MELYLQDRNYRATMVTMLKMLLIEKNKIYNISAGTCNSFGYLDGGTIGQSNNSVVNNIIYNQTGGYVVIFIDV